MSRIRDRVLRFLRRIGALKVQAADVLDRAGRVTDVIFTRPAGGVDTDISAENKESEGEK